MALTKKEQKTMEELKQLQPKKDAVDAKMLSDYKWNDDLFIAYKTYKTSNDENAQFKNEKAHWRKFFIGGKHIVAVQGEKLSKAEYEIFKGMDKDVQDQYIVKVAKVKKSSDK